MKLNEVLSLVRPHLLSLEPYSSARDEFDQGFGGKGFAYLDANENPFNNGYNRYPDPHQRELKRKISRLKGINIDNIFIGNGSDVGVFAHGDNARELERMVRYGMTPAQALHAATDGAAKILRQGDRFGRIAPGLRADLNLIDPARLSVGTPKLVHDLPAGGKRFLQKAEGYLATWVNGQPVQRDGTITTARPGRLVRMG